MFLSPEITSNLAAFNRALRQYATLTTKTLDEVLEKKGRALSIALFQGFAAHKWSAGRKGAGAVLGAMFATATRLPRSAYRQGNRLTDSAAGQVPVRKPVAGAPWSGSIPDTTSNGAAMGAWRAAVAQEVLRRRAGVGVLGASFLWYRYRSNNAMGTFIVKNKAGKGLGAVERGDGFIRIIGYTEGLEKIDLDYGIVSAAIARETDDMDVYIQRKMQEMFGQVAWPKSGELAA